VKSLLTNNKNNGIILVRTKCMDKTGKEYEEFVARLQEAIFDSEQYTSQKNILIQKNKKLFDKNGLEREFDIYWEYELGGFTYKTIIECKDYNSTISIEKIDALIGKIKDIPDLKAIFATKLGYQSGARIKASQNNIDLIIVREQNDSDWADEYGNPLIQIVNINGTLYIPARISKFQPLFDGKWIKENTNIDITKPIQLRGLNNEIIIDDIDGKENYSLYELAEKLTSLEDNKPGEYERIKEFSDAYLVFKELRLKLRSYKVSYQIPKPIESNIHIDFSQELLGVIEYLEKGIKKKNFKDGNVQNDRLIQ
jgi:hypothetical protein